MEGGIVVINIYTKLLNSVFFQDFIPVKKVQFSYILMTYYEVNPIFSWDAGSTFRLLMLQDQFDRIDTNHDGVLQRSEWDEAMQAPTALDQWHPQKACHG